MKKPEKPIKSIKKQLRTLPLSNLVRRRLKRAYRILHEQTMEGSKAPKQTIMRANDSARTIMIDLLTEFFPDDYIIGPGIITDSQGNLSSRFDLVISRPAYIDFGFPDIDGTQVIAYEDVYVVGDVNVLAMPHDLITLAQKVNHLITSLSREKTPADFISDAGPIHLKSADRPPLSMYRNPLFSLFFSYYKSPLEFPNLDTGDGNWSHLQFLSSVYAEVQGAPTMTVMLDSAIVLPAQVRVSETGEVISMGQLITPSWLDRPDHIDSEYRHEWLLWATKVDAPVANFATMVSAISEHLRTCVLRPADIASYFDYDRVVTGLNLIAPI